MLGNMPRLISVWGTIAVSLTGTASAQWYPGRNPCECVLPVAQARYQTVPVTEYREVKQTVQRPVVETQYVDREVTEYRPVVETRTAEVPTVHYEDITEWQTVQRDAGCWATHYEHRPKVSPCEYDPRPGLLGALNRTSHSIRSAFTPSVVARRQYVPNVVTEAVPVTRRVARHGTRQVSYNVTQMVPHTTTKKVAVNSVRYVNEEVVSTQPVTVMRTVPIGTSVAYAVSPYGSPSQTALQPSPDPASTAKAPQRTADSRNDRYEDNEPPERFDRDPNTFPSFDEEDFDEDNGETTSTVPPAGAPVPSRFSESDPEETDRFRRTRLERGRAVSPPSVVRVSRFASQGGGVKAGESQQGPSLTGPTLSVAGAER